ncbi:hypothetical protein [Rhizobium sp. FKY42]|uniref:hypothetical protein n=1 Tax=Rhizobium sp. FKY42 TaxID=2562310 RepID=UPI0010C10CE8|nr:hypothetical protein [Rhizobium sp. FKY42]
MISENENDDWILRPKVGLGKIHFGMHRELIHQFTGYGGVLASRGNEAMPADEAASFLNSLGFSTDTVTAAVDAHVKSARPATLIETHSTGVVFEYELNKLSEIMATNKAIHITYRSKRIFEEDPRKMIETIKLNLEEDPLIFEQEVIFPLNCIYLFEFLCQNENNRNIVSEGKKSDRTIIWRSKPRVGGADLSDYRPLVF